MTCCLVQNDAAEIDLTVCVAKQSPVPFTVMPLMIFATEVNKQPVVLPWAADIGDDMLLQSLSTLAAARSTCSYCSRMRFYLSESQAPAEPLHRYIEMSHYLCHLAAELHLPRQA